MNTFGVNERIAVGAMRYLDLELLYMAVSSYLTEVIHIRIQNMESV